MTPTKRAFRPMIPGIGGELAELMGRKRLQEVPLTSIHIAPGHNPRGRLNSQVFSDEALADLAESIKEKGVLQPIWLRQDGERHILIAGERRFRAAGLAGLQFIPALLFGEMSGAQALELAIIENAQREELSLVEQTFAGFQMMEHLTGMDQAEVVSYLHRVRKGRQADTFGLSALLRVTYGSDVSVWSQQRSKILALTDLERQAVESGKMPAKSLYPLQKLKDAEARKKLFMQALEGGWSHQQVKATVDALSHQHIQKKADLTKVLNRALPQLKALDGAKALRAQELLAELTTLLDENTA
ncbi:nucleoid occlusion protein [Deinococcus xinjiangensis]|uniref:Nucleoid occlusion protein n=1 Tax=Deinococcus xinjiangensis TaxID=457454 RepID=A0ABP9V8S6_9DEIO